MSERVASSIVESLARLEALQKAQRERDDGYRRQLARLRTQRSDAAKKLEAANVDLHDEWLFTARRTLELAKSAAELWVSRSGAEKRVLLEMMPSNPTPTGRKVSYELKKPFAVLAEIRRKGVGRAP